MEVFGRSISNLRSLALLFLKLGTTAFGGPAAHVAMMEAEVVQRRGWLSSEEFLDYVSATNFIPGPNSTELAIHIGYKRGGWPGLLIAGTCFIFPASLIVLLIAWAYVSFGKLPQAEGLLYAIKPVMIAIVAQALWRLGHSAIKTRWLGLVAVLCLGLIFAGVHELLVLGIGGLLAFAPRWRENKSISLFGIPGLFSGFGLSESISAAGSTSIFWVFAKIGSVLFGSGYVLLAFLRSDLVIRYHWLTEQQLLDAITVGQITPGPVFTTATFVGYLLHGYSGAAAATIGIFLPAFLFVALSAPIIPKLRSSRTATAILDGVNVASLSLMAFVTGKLAGTAIVDALTLSIAAISLFLLFRFSRLNSVWLILIAAVFGLAKAVLL